MIKPHGSETLNPLYVEDDAARAALLSEAESLPSLLLNSAAAANAVMMAGGYFNPLTGYMNKADALSVAKDLKTTDGLFWPVPVMNLTQTTDVQTGKLALRDPNVDGNPILAVMDVAAVETVSDDELKTMAEQIFGTLDGDHPGVSTFLSLGNTLLSGSIQVLNFSYFAADFPATFRTAVEIRNEIAERGWNKVVAFQTRNPIHRAHEYLCKCTQEITDGLLIHPLVGETKPGDIPADVRMDCYQALIKEYFVPERTLLSVMPAAMRYAGPREAILHALVRKNYGVTHFIVGRDHAGVGSYYGTYDAQHIFNEIDLDNLGIIPLMFEHSGWSKTYGGMVSFKSFPKMEGDIVFLSGTKVREMLEAGERPPMEFSRPEVADVLIGAAKNNKLFV